MLTFCIAIIFITVFISIANSASANNENSNHSRFFWMEDNKKTLVVDLNALGFLPQYLRLRLGNQLIAETSLDKMPTDERVAFELDLQQGDTYTLEIETDKQSIQKKLIV